MRRQLFNKLRNASWPPLTISNDPDYPTQVTAVGEGDAYERDLLQQAWQKPLDALTRQNLSDDELIWPVDVTPNQNVALCRLGGIVCQIVKQRTPRHNLVLGRVGAISILLRLLSKRLSISSADSPLTITDLARIIENSDNLKNPEGRVRFLDRLNSGRYVAEPAVVRIAERLGIEASELVFETGIYESAARDRRREGRADRIDKRRKALRNVELKIQRVDLGELQLVRRILDLHQHCHIDRQHLSPELLTQERRDAIAALVECLTLPPSRHQAAKRKLVGALAALEESGIEAWCGEYETRAPVYPECPKIASYTESHMTIILVGAGSPAPKGLVDLSNTIGLGPDIDDA
jgi:hypothetical protein